MIDFHTHILPGLDDGPREIEESLAIVSFLAELGFDHIFLTPHFRQSFFETPAGKVREVSGQLRAALRNGLSAIRLTEAHEVHLGSVFDSRGNVQGFLTFGVSQRLVLLELPREPFPFELFLRIIDRLFVEGIHVVLAHPEKNVELSSEPARYRELLERGVKFQLNLTSLSDFAGRRARKTAEALCREGMVHAFGTDAHSLAHVVAFVPKGIRQAVRILGKNRLRAIMEGDELHLGE